MKKPYRYVCPRGHKWARLSYGGIMNWSMCPRCHQIGVAERIARPAECIGHIVR